MAQGTILLHIQKGARYSSISVVDNGIGIREAAKPSSLGYKLIHRLVYDKLKGKLDVRTSAEGTIAQFTFANNSENL